MTAPRRLALLASLQIGLGAGLVGLLSWAGHAAATPGATELAHRLHLAAWLAPLLVATTAVLSHRFLLADVLREADGPVGGGATTERCGQTTTPKVREGIPAALPPAIDVGLALERAGGDDALARELSAMFHDEGPRTVERLRTALAAGDLRAVEALAHSVKSSLGVIGATCAAELGRDLETSGRDDDLPRARERFRMFEAEIARIIDPPRDGAGRAA